MAHKGFDLLIRAFGKVVNRFSGVDLLIVGDGPERNSLQNLTIRIGV
jgi:glycosyltransferase involved in cell wall biosynthesis